ncbi:MAG: NAD(P)H-hydrate dehydratase [archaeon]
MITSRQQKALELNSEYLGVSVETLMENAGKAVFYELSKKAKTKGKKIHVYAGPGNNGGDAFVVARHLSAESDVSVFTFSEPKTELAMKKFADVKEISSQINSPDDLPKSEPDIIIDGIFGTGTNGEIREPYKSAVSKINKSKAYTLSIDIPSGADPDTGEGFQVRPDLIVSMHDAKPGFPKALKADIGIPSAAEKLCGPGDVFLGVRGRDPDSHKGQNGVVLVIGGSSTFVGAPILAALAAARSGADGVILAAPERVADAAKQWPDLITIPLKGNALQSQHLSEIKDQIAKADVILFGPGAGLLPETQDFASQLAKKADKPLVIDADGIALLAKFKPKALWTPHHKEFETLTGKSPGEQNVKSSAKQFGTILLKGRTDIISDGERTKLNNTGNPGMTKFGTGDVLAGLAAGLYAQNKNAFEAACAAAFANGAAGDRLFKEYGYGFLASDLLNEIPKVLYGTIWK